MSMSASVSVLSVCGESERFSRAEGFAILLGGSRPDLLRVKSGKRSCGRGTLLVRPLCWQKFLTTFFHRKRKIRVLQ